MAHAERPLSLPVHDEHSSDPAIAAPLRDAKAAFGMVPNLFARMVNVPGLLATYRTGYDAFSAGGFSPAEQAVVFLAISRFHACTYCVTAHSLMAKMVELPAAVVEALRAGEALPDPKLDALSTFTRVMLETRGRPTAADLEAFLAAGYAERDVLQIILAIAVKTISNYTNHVFHTPIDDAFASQRWEDPDEQGA